MEVVEYIQADDVWAVGLVVDWNCLIMEFRGFCFGDCEGFDIEGAPGGVFFGGGTELVDCFIGAEGGGKLAGVVG